LRSASANLNHTRRAKRVSSGFKSRGTPTAVARSRLGCFDGTCVVRPDSHRVISSTTLPDRQGLQPCVCGRRLRVVRNIWKQAGTVTYIFSDVFSSVPVSAMDRLGRSPSRERAVP